MATMQKSDLLATTHLNISLELRMVQHRNEKHKKYKISQEDCNNITK